MNVKRLKELLNQFDDNEELYILNQFDDELLKSYGVLKYEGKLFISYEVL